MNLKTRKKVYEGIFFDVQKYVYSEKSIQYTKLWDKTQMLKNSFGQIKQWKKWPFFLSWVPTHHIFTFNLWFLNLNLKLCVGFSIFDSVSFLLKFIQYSLHLTDTLKGTHLWLGDNFLFTSRILVKVF